MKNDQLNSLLHWIRSYASERINSRLIDERRCFPPYIVLDLGNQGLLGMHAPKAYGGLELDNYSALKILQQLGAVDPSLGLFVGLNNILGIRPILKFANLKVREELLPILVPGRQLASFALTEPEAGSNPHAIQSYAMPAGINQWQLYGKKIWSGSAAWAGVINVFVRLYDDKKNDLGITGFVLKQGTQGLRQGPEALTMGMRGMVQNAFYLEGALTNVDYCLGKLGAGMDVAQDAMMYGRLAIGAVTLGSMKRCAQLLLRYAGRRHIATGKLLDNPVTLAKLAEITAASAALEALIDTVAIFLDQNEDVPVELLTVCKIIGSEYFWRAADSLVQGLGGRGYIENNIAPQLLRDARVFRVFEGPTETLFSYLGSRVLNNSQVLFKFIENKLHANHINKKIDSILAKVQEHFTQNNLKKLNNVANLQWQTYVLGELVCYCILLSAVEYANKNKPTAELERSSLWVQQCIEQLLKQRLDNQTALSSVMLNSEGIQELIHAYQTSIADIEQSMLGEDHALDSYLVKHHAKKINDAPLIVEEEASEGNKTIVDDEKFSELKNWLKQKIIKKLKLTEVSDSQTFFELGLDSVTVLQLVADLEDRIDCEIPTEVMWKYNNINKLTSYLTSLATDNTVVAAAEENSIINKMQHDISLFSKTVINPQKLSYQHKAEPTAILLTGATGFLGAFLLKHLLNTTKANVYCLVRAATPIEAFSRIETNLKKYNLTCADEILRVKPLCGDLSKPQLGLSDNDYQMLAQTIEVIYHNGALVNHLYDYESMRATNVLATQEMIRLAGQHKIKPIHFISSLGVCIKSGNSTCENETALNDPSHLVIGYTQTKWVSEQMLLDANKAGIPTTIFRCGMVAGDSKVGTAKTDDLFHSFIKLFIEVGKAPATSDQVIDVVPIDYVCAAMTHVAARTANFGKIYHLANPKPIQLTEFFSYLRSRNYIFETVSFDNWIKSCQQYLDSASDNNKNIVLSKYFEQTSYGRGVDTYFNAYRYNQNNVRAALADSDIKFPEFDKQLLDTYFNFFESSKFIARPEEIMCE